MPPRRPVNAEMLDHLEERLSAVARRESTLTPYEVEALGNVIAELRAMRQDGETEADERDDDATTPASASVAKVLTMSCPHCWALNETTREDCVKCQRALHREKS